MAFPGALASFLGFTASHTLSADSHASQHNSEQAEIVAAQTKIGTGASTATNHSVLRGNGTGTSIWGPVDLTADVTGVLPSANLPVTTILAQAYPVGSIYINASDSTNPGTLLGFGTWAQASRGRVLLGEGTSDKAFAISSTGGESNHALTISELATHTHIQDAHSHTMLGNTADPGTTGHQGSAGAQNPDNNQGPTQTTVATNQNTGSGTAHNNLQPYLTVYIWQRTA